LRVQPATVQTSAHNHTPRSCWQSDAENQKGAKDKVEEDPKGMPPSPTNIIQTSPKPTFTRTCNNIHAHAKTTKTKPKPPTQQQTATQTQTEKSNFHHKKFFPHSY